MAVTPLDGWTNDPAHMYEDYYWADKPDTVRGVLEKRYGLSDMKPIWTLAPKYGAILFILEANDTNKKQLYYLWNGFEDTVSQFEEETLQNIKNEIISGQGTLKKVNFKDLE